MEKVSKHYTKKTNKGEEYGCQAETVYMKAWATANLRRETEK